VFAEYRYTSYGSTAFTLPLSELSTTSATKVGAIEFGVNYMFNGRGPFAPVTGAADVGLPVAKGPRVRSPYNWTGFYFGADGGFAWQRATGTLTTASGAVLTPYGYSGTGPFAGSFVGGNYQFNRFVLGVEGDWQWSNLTGSNQTLAPLGATGVLPSGPFAVSTTTKDYGSIRGRLGVAFDASWSSAPGDGPLAILRLLSP
jgi:hypothetical protein